MPYGLTLSQSVSRADEKQMNSNGHFCSTDKFTILANELDIVGHIFFIRTKTLYLFILNSFFEMT